MGNGQSWSPLFEEDPHTDEKKMSQKSKEHMVMPSQPTTQFVVVETDFDFASAEDDFDGPAHQWHAHQFQRFDLGRRIAKVVLDFGRIFDVTAQDEPAFRAWQTIPGLPELEAPEDLETDPSQPQIVSF